MHAQIDLKLHCPRSALSLISKRCIACFIIIIVVVVVCRYISKPIVRFWLFMEESGAKDLDVFLSMTNIWKKLIGLAFE